MAPAENNLCSPSNKKISTWNDPELTVEGAYDLRIEDARAVVEKLCIKKAKLEALNMHKLPYHSMRELFESYPI